MSTTTSTVQPVSEYHHYRELCSLSVISTICGFLSVASLRLVGIFSESPLLFALLPGLGMLVGLRSLMRIRRSGGEMSGTKFAVAGLLLSLIALVSGWSWMGYVYATEVPDGYVRLHYYELQPGKNSTELLPESAFAFQGKKVFIKGFVYPDATQTTGIHRFILCRDNGDCCFGGSPKLTDMIQVTLKDSQSLEYNPFMLKVAGTFRIENDLALHGLGQVLYHLDDAEFYQ